MALGNTFAVARHALIVAAAMGPLAFAASPAFADGDGAGRGLAGVWSVQVTLRNCATGAPLGPPFNSLVTFHRGGTLSESTASLAFAIGQRPGATGTWARTGARTYRQRMVALVVFETPPNPPVSPGFLAGWQTVTHAVEMSDADTFTSVGTSDLYNSAGEIYRTGCSTAVGRRFE